MSRLFLCIMSNPENPYKKIESMTLDELVSVSNVMNAFLRCDGRCPAYYEASMALYGRKLKASEVIAMAGGCGMHCSVPGDMYNAMEKYREIKYMEQLEADGCDLNPGKEPH